MPTSMNRMPMSESDDASAKLARPDATALLLIESDGKGVPHNHSFIGVKSGETAVELCASA